MNGIVYMYRSKTSGKLYIGQTIHEKRRINYLKNGYNSCSYFHNAIKKHGFDDFEYEVLHTGIDNHMDLDLLESREIIERNTLAPNGYNLVIGSRKSEISEYSRKKMRNAKLGKRNTEQHNKNISKAMMGRVFSEETKRKLSLSLTGKILSEETKRKISEKKANAPIICIETNVIYKSQKEASIKTGVNQGNISLAISGKKRSRAGGFHWRYYNDILGQDGHAPSPKIETSF